MRIYGDRKSGNCYKVQLTADLLRQNYEWLDVDILAGDTQKTDFLKRNPNGKIPLLELDDGRLLSESNAIINFLAEGSHLYPQDPWLRAQIHQWQFFEQYSHEPFVAVARFIAKYLGLPEDMRETYQAKQEGGHKALRVMEQHLSQATYLVGNNVTCADISLFAYTHVAEEGGFDLSIYPGIKAWIDRVASLKHFSPMWR